MTRRFVHPTLNEEVRAIGGGYYFTKELRLDLDGRDVLALIGVGIIDSSCCGTGGCSYAFVPGFVDGFEIDADPEGAPVSMVEPILDGAMRKRITRQLKDAEHVMDVRFWTSEGP